MNIIEKQNHFTSLHVLFKHDKIAILLLFKKGFIRNFVKKTLVIFFSKPSKIVFNLIEIIFFTDFQNIRFLNNKINKIIIEKILIKKMKFNLKKI